MQQVPAHKIVELLSIAPHQLALLAESDRPDSARANVSAPSNLVAVQARELYSPANVPLEFEELSANAELHFQDLPVELQFF